jgi:hypothetical protein
MLGPNVLPGVQGADIYTLIFGSISLLVVGGVYVSNRNNWCSAALTR